MLNSSSHKTLSATIGCFVFLLFAAFPIISLAQAQKYVEWHNGVTERWFVDTSEFSQEKLGSAIERWKLIEAENLQQKSHEWAGGYFIGSDTHGSYLRWSPRAGFVMANVNKCAAMLMGLSFGKVVASPTSVRLIYEYHRLSNSHGHGHSPKAAPTEIKFRPIKWRGNRYLIEEKRMAEFGEFVAGLGKHNQEFAWPADMIFFSGGEEPKASSGELPIVPQGYERFIRKPIEAKITFVGKPQLKRYRDEFGTIHKEKHIPVRVNVGRSQGVKRGMYLHVLSHEEGETVRVKRVGENSSEGVIIRWLDEDLREVRDLPQVRLGWRVSTMPGE